MSHGMNKSKPSTTTTTTYNLTQLINKLNHSSSPTMSFRNFVNVSNTSKRDSPSGEPTPNQSVFNIRFAVNGLSKFYQFSNSIPELNKSIQSGDFGDDAGMIAENSKCVVVGLADGAGGNRSIGIDPQRFSRSLLAHCVEILRNEEVLPNEMAKLACKSVHMLERNNVEGSGTICLLSINKKTNVMHALNMGDSGFRVIRNGKVVSKSEATMAGSSPKQVYVSKQQNYSGISFVTEKDIANDSDIRAFVLQKGDLIVLGSDGIYDVVSDAKIEEVVNKREPKDLQGIADDLVKKSMSSYTTTRRDDILIMVCRVEEKTPF